ncbi:MAG: aminopeptidase [Desulfobacterales bacterium]|nr:aminopeptidase [Desulfobacterales bacterium]
MNKKAIESLKEKLSKPQNLVIDALPDDQAETPTAFCQDYKRFLDQAKTEREAVRAIVAMARENGFVDLDDAVQKEKANTPTRVFRVYKNRAVAMAVMGKDKMETGCRIIASHIDAPRLDLKQNPLYEDLDLALLKTHYYGGIRKYQWLCIPLALHGTIVDGQGKTHEISLGEALDDPIFTITDLLPHLAREQAGKKISDVFQGEKLNLLAGSLPLGDSSIKDRFKLGILKLLNDEYGITEEDFISADLEVVPAGPARDVGFDRSMVGAYGQDDRICAYTSLKALLETPSPAQTGIAFFFDKEEIGSDGHSGAKSRLVEDFMADLMLLDQGKADSHSLRKAMMRSACLSADVNAAMDPDYKDVHESSNAPLLGHGPCLTKFTGSGGKSGSSEADAEFMGHVRNLFNQNKVTWQTGELGKIDQGGGGTVAKFLAKYGMDVLDCGPALLSMHAPLEVSSKADVYMTYRAYQAFYGGVYPNGNE